ncbi:toll/interleukin-1 receptor domain-containing protein [Acidovorax sp. SUPP2539]|uniref:toll/interleukin-1 receptor domain-containing protein n=1 Tax=Acidovorax sp. SUPP2539 TaxID=2920878 RepID=UPI0023DE4A6D|nr:toll/interleukin-1 receptor domain-containing protein [Acidovorax sp. SUPP2539]GKS89455.1 toll/interleukin-1 receptor domain-containing protein [Acidovorax sp. SUPP2539]
MTTLFFSYSHKDEALRNELEAHLGLLLQQGHIEVWHDRRIGAGDEIDTAIDVQLEAADIILLLISSDFIKSTYCYSKEMQRAVERHEAGEARVVPVILRPCDWHSAPFGTLLAVPRDGRAVTLWPNQDEAFADVAAQIRRLVGTPTSTKKAVPAARAPARLPEAADEGSAMNAVAGAASLPRSSNLRLKQEFTERDRHQFVRATFEYICRFFQGSLQELQARNPQLESNFEQVDSRRMAAMLYRNGKTIAQCSIRIDGFGREDGIAYSTDTSTERGSYNELLSIDVTDQAMHMKSSMSMGWSAGQRDANLSQEGAAEALWGMFIRNAQI